MAVEYTVELRFYKPVFVYRRFIYELVTDRIIRTTLGRIFSYTNACSETVLGRILFGYGIKIENEILFTTDEQI